MRRHNFFKLINLCAVIHFDAFSWGGESSLSEKSPNMRHKCPSGEEEVALTLIVVDWAGTEAVSGDCATPEAPLIDD
jgi:hypothetical protein